MSEPRAFLRVASPTSRRSVALGAGSLALACGALLAWRSAHSRPPIAAGRPALHSAIAPAAEVEDPRVSLGRALFFDPSLSEPAGTSCASCHEPRRGYSGNHGSSLGVAQGSRPGHYARRNTPSVMYLRFVRKPLLVWEEEADRPELFGGFFWDGRARTIAALVREPLLNPDEMGNRDLHQIARKLEASASAEPLRREFSGVFASDERALHALSLCIEAFLTSRPMSPFSSKYDEYVRGRARLSEREQRGLALFQDLEKGACAACHRLDPSSELPESSMFTDYGYDAIAVPRNPRLPANQDPARHDLGVCDRPDARFHTEDPWFCGTFRTPSLRNVALRGPYMHNGYFSELRDVVAFYATRATNPERWYGAEAFDDLPREYQDNVNATLPPYDQRPGQRPRLDDAEIDAIVAFLGTLSDERIP